MSEQQTHGTFSKEVDGTTYTREAGTVEAAVAFRFDGWQELSPKDAKAAAKSDK